MATSRNHHHPHSGNVLPESPPALPQRTDSPFFSVFSDVTMEEEEEYEIEDGADDSSSSHRMSSLSVLEYSDDTEDYNRPARRGSNNNNNNGGGGGRSQFRNREYSPTKTSSQHVVRFNGDVAEEQGPIISRQQQFHRQQQQQRNSSKPRADVENQAGGGRSKRHHRSRHHKKQKHRGVPPEMNENNNNDTNWMKRLAHSFRSPIVNTKHFLPGSGGSDSSGGAAAAVAAAAPPHHRRQGSGVMEAYPHYSSTGEYNLDSSAVPPPPPAPAGAAAYQQGSMMRPDQMSLSTEESPLLGADVYSSSMAGSEMRAMSSEIPAAGGGTTSFLGPQQHRRRHDDDDDDEGEENTKLSVEIAAAFLQDYEANRPPSFASSTDISEYQVKLYSLKYSYAAVTCQLLATMAFFASSFLEGFVVLNDGQGYYSYHRYTLTALNMFAIAVFAFDMWLRRQLRGAPSIKSAITAIAAGKPLIEKLPGASPPHRSDSLRALEEKHEIRTSRSRKLVKPLILFCVILGLENIARLFLVSDGMVLFSSIMKPLVLFYVSSQARDALAAVRRILKIVLRVLIMELLLILMFAAVACRLFHKFEKFATLNVAWLSLFELSTTVVNPSIWMPMYEQSRFSALFFIFFIVTSVFYLHSLVLSVVFQTYIQAAAEIHQRSAADREDAVQLAFTALRQEKQLYQYSNNKEVIRDNVVYTQLVRDTLCLLRPHYNAMKINALVEIVDSSNQGFVDYPTFRTKIRQALNASIRTARTASALAMSIELIAVAVAVVNFIYVLLVSSPFEAQWFTVVQVQAGCLITLVAAFELLTRFNPLHIPDFTPLTRLNATFDGSALAAALISCIGIGLHLADRPMALEYILVGRAIDMIRIMRFFQIFRDIVRRSSDVVPALVGPLILVLTTLHVFVYIGMGLWGGSVEVGMHEGQITPRYDLNNFNSYQEGSVTMFQVLVVNDWHAIAEVFVYATRCANAYIVYPFFIIANLIGVSIMLNVLTAFFVESFVTKINDDKDAPAEATATMHKEKDFSIQNPSERGIRRLASSGPRHSSRSVGNNSFDRGADADSEASSESEMFEFDVYEREGFDKIMQTVAGVQSHYDSDFARHICNYLEIFESLSPGRETVGYLVCDQQSLDRFGNRRFKTKAIGFLEESKLHSVVSDMHAELLALAPRSSFQDRSLIRTLPHKRDPSKTLEISASLLRRHPALSLFVSRTITPPLNSGGGTPPLPEKRKA